MARDAFHNAVRHALLDYKTHLRAQSLEKEGWRITNDPLRLEYKGAKLEIDLGAERFIAAERDEERIAVEIKSFASGSALSEFHTALGQYLNYRRALEQSDPLRKLFLAVPRDTFETFFQLPFTQEAVEFHQLALIVYQPITEVIVQWS